MIYSTPRTAGAASGAGGSLAEPLAAYGGAAMQAVGWVEEGIQGMHR